MINTILIANSGDAIVGSYVSPVFVTTYTVATSTGVLITATSSGFQRFVNPISQSWDPGAASGFTSQTFGDSQTFRFTVANSGGFTDQETVHLYWGQYCHYGASSGGTITEDFIKGLSNSGFLINNPVLDIDYAVGDTTGYAYFAFRDGSDDIQFKDVNGLVGGFTKVASGISLTNSAGFAETYHVYRSDYSGIGNVKFSVSGGVS